MKPLSIATREELSTTMSEVKHPGGWLRWPSFPRFYEMWLIWTEQMSLHLAWQRGYDQHIRDESARNARGGK